MLFRYLGRNRWGWWDQDGKKDYSKDKGRNDVAAGGEAGSGQERDRISLIDLHITAKVTSDY